MFKINELINFFFAFCDAPEPWQLGLQDPATPAVEGMIFFHDYLMLFLIIIGLFVMWMLYVVIISFNEKSNPVSEKFTHSSVLEIVWTILPALVLLLIAIPSFTLLSPIPLGNTFINESITSLRLGTRLPG